MMVDSTVLQRLDVGVNMFAVSGNEDAVGGVGQVTRFCSTINKGC